MVVDVFLNSVIETVLLHFFIPASAIAPIQKMKGVMRDVLDGVFRPSTSGSRSESAGGGGKNVSWDKQLEEEADEEKTNFDFYTDSTTFSYTDFFFVSARVAAQFPDLLASRLILSYRSPFPIESHTEMEPLCSGGPEEKEISEFSVQEGDEGFFNKKKAKHWVSVIYVFMLKACHAYGLLPMWIQKAGVHVMQPFVFAVLAFLLAWMSVSVVAACVIPVLSLLAVAAFFTLADPGTRMKIAQRLALLTPRLNLGGWNRVMPIVAAGKKPQPQPVVTNWGAEAVAVDVDDGVAADAGLLAESDARARAGAGVGAGAEGVGSSLILGVVSDDGDEEFWKDAGELMKDDDDNSSDYIKDVASEGSERSPEQSFSPDAVGPGGGGPSPAVGAGEGPPSSQGAAAPPTQAVQSSVEENEEGSIVQKLRGMDDEELFKTDFLEEERSIVSKKANKADKKKAPRKLE